MHPTHLALFETTTIGLCAVERTSLLGYRVSAPGVGSMVLDLADLDAMMSPPVVEGFVSAARAFGSTVVERWVKGVHAERRAAQIRRAGVNATTRTVTSVRKLWAEAGADRTSDEQTEITYCQGEKVPSIVPVQRTRTLKPVW